MDRLYEIIAISLLCLIGVSLSDSFVAPVIVFIISITLISLAGYFGKPVSYVIIVVLSLSCGIMPLFFCMVPMIMYVALWEKKWYLVTPSLLAFRMIDSFSTDVIATEPDMTNLLQDMMKPLSGIQYLIGLMGAVISVILYIRISNVDIANAKLRELRDEISEKNEILKSQNKKLMEAQDDEINLATMKERNRIAREIHDNVGHMLTRSLLQTGALKIANKDEALREPIEELHSTLDHAMTSIRKSVHDLHDDSIDLKSLIYECTEPAKDRFNVDIEYKLDPHIPTAIRLCMAGIVKEAVSNAIRHSDGDVLSIGAYSEPSSYNLRIKDNGSKTDIKNTGIGLANMRERAREAGGTLKIVSDDTGFGVDLFIPIVK